MTESKKNRQGLLTEGSEEFEVLLDKKAIYDLKNIPGVPARSPKDKSPTTPATAVEDYASEQSEDDYLPPTLRSSFTISNKSLTVLNTNGINNKLSISPPLSKRKKVDARTKKRRSLRRTKSEKSKTLFVPKDLQEDGLAKSFRDYSIDDEESLTEEDTERKFKSEELRKPERRGSAVRQRRKSEIVTQRSIGYRREKGRPRKSNPIKETASPESSKKPASMQRLKSHRSRSRRTSSSSISLDETDVEKRIVDWKRTSKEQLETPQRQKQLEPEAETQKQKPKKSTGSSAGRIKKPKSSNSISHSLDASENTGPSPHQEQRKRSQRLLLQKKSLKQKQVEPQKQTPSRSTESSAAKSRNPKSRRNMMLSSKATTPSCRNLLRKIHYMNDERLSKQNQSEHDDKEKNLAPIDDLSRSTLSTLSTTHSTNHSLTDEDANHNSFSSFSKQQEESRDRNPKEESKDHSKVEEESKDHSKVEEESKDRKLPRTKSAPLNLMRKNKSSNSKISRSNSSEKMQMMGIRNAKTAITTLPQKRSMKNSLSGSLMKFGLFLEGKGANKKNGVSDDETARTGNRNKDKQGRRKPPLLRSRSDSSITSKKQREKSSQFASLRMKKPREGSSQYDLMLSLHSLSDEFLVEGSQQNVGAESDVESDDDNSFSGDGDAEFKEGVESTRDLNVREASNPRQMKTVQSSPTEDLTNKVTDGVNNDLGSEESVPSDMVSTASFTNEATQGGNRKVGEHMGRDNLNGRAVIVEHVDDVLSMAEFSDHQSQIALTVEKEPKKPPSCLQIDFSQLSEHGTSGNIVVRSKKLGKRNSNSNNKSNRKLRVSRSSPALVA